MSIYFHNEDVSDVKFKRLETKKWIKNTINQLEKKEGEINFIFCSDEYLLQVNKEYLNHNYFTDVITFDYVENNVISGDIFISIDTIKKNAKEFNTNFLDELNRVMIHGVLHLLGFKDKTTEEQKLMTEKENYFLEKRTMF